MKRIRYFLAVFSLLLLLGCDSDLKIINPNLLTVPSEPYLYDTITNTIIAYAEIDGDEVNIDTYDWTIVDQNGDPVNIQSKEKNEVKWIPLKLGVYTIEVTMTSDNKSLTEINQIDVGFNSSSVQKYLTGEWYGRGQKTNGDEWLASFHIDDNGHYIGIIEAITSGSINSVVDDMSVDSIDHPNKIINIHFMVDDSTFFGGYCFTSSDGGLFVSDLYHIRLRKDFNGLHFEPFNNGDTIYYNLERQ